MSPLTLLFVAIVSYVIYILGYLSGKYSKGESVSYKPDHSELSNPRKVPRSFKMNHTRAITKKVLEDNPEARDDKELFISIVSCHTSKFTALENFSRSWRYVQQHFPELRGKHWVDRQVHSDLIRKSI